MHGRANAIGAEGISVGQIVRITNAQLNERKGDLTNTPMAQARGRKHKQNPSRVSERAMRARDEAARDICVCERGGNLSSSL